MTEQQQLLTIAELAKRYGVTHRTLRFYDQRGLIKPKRDGRQHLYSESDAAKLALILRAKSLGFTIEEAKEIVVPDGFSGWRLEVSPQRAEQQLKLMHQRVVEATTACEWLRAVVAEAGREAA